MELSEVQLEHISEVLFSVSLKALEEVKRTCNRAVVFYTKTWKRLPRQEAPPVSRISRRRKARVERKTEEPRTDWSLLQTSCHHLFSFCC
mmetsp:Transcript_29816/g.71095  ORF Transcript_29816/g.71095 Transcript_29816/m.71095 type:complete len:90 (-) Transcript_29816:126-395(-)